jgi:hypothetical protein
MSTVKFVVKDMHHAEIAELVKHHYSVLKTLKKTGVRCGGASEATISQIINGLYDEVKAPMWTRIAAALGWRPVGWQEVVTRNVSYLQTFMQDAQNCKWMLCVSENEGSGKTTAARTYTGGTHFHIKCEQWNKGVFCKKLAQTIGESHLGYVTYYDLLEGIISKLQQKALSEPILITFDQVDWLKDDALLCLIPIFNGLEDIAGMVLMGVPHLEKRLNNGASKNYCGYRELKSRFGNTFLKLPGNTKRDCYNTMIANGIEDKETQDEIFNKVWNKEKGWDYTEKGEKFKILRDMRPLKLAVQGELRRRMFEAQNDKINAALNSATDELEDFEPAQAEDAVAA